MPPILTTFTSLCTLAIASCIGIWLIESPPVQSQSITPATDGTGTIVTPNGHQFNITGGSTSVDQQNLFHSFQQFGLSSGQIANFIANPQLRNILGRITGGSPSLIDGLIQVSGGNPNLFLMNPAGIVFGANASLNVPAAFTATTANGIAFGNQWFSATGANNYDGLVGNPSAFAFSALQPGAIINAGNLAVAPGQTLMLLGGTVINTGSLAAPGGQIIVSAVPGEKLVRVSQEGSLLSLEFQPLGNNLPNAAIASPPTLPQLLTGGDLGSATGITVENGVVKLTSTNTTIPTPAGTTIVSGQLSTASDGVGGAVSVLGDRVGLFSANIEASGQLGGGTVLIGGDFQGHGTTPVAQFTVVDSMSAIQANALTSGNGGKVIVWADTTTSFSGTISAKGGTLSGQGGFAEVSGKENLQYSGAADLSATNGQSGTLVLDPANIIIVSGTGADDTQLSDGQILAGDGGAANFTISVGAIQSSLLSNSTILQASNDITWNSGADLDYNGIGIGKTLTLEANGNINSSSQIFDSSPGGDSLNVTFNADADANGTGSISINNAIATQGGNFYANAASNSGSVILNSPVTSQGGNIALTGASLDLRGNSITSGGGSISLNGATMLNSSIGLTTINSTNGAAGGDITFGGKIGAISSPSQSLVLNAGSGNIVFNGAVGTAAASYDSVVLANTPYAYWKFDETSGTIASDSSGNGRNGTYNSITFGQPGLIGDSTSSILFAGNTGSFVDLGLTDIAGPWTAEFWVNRQDALTASAALLGSAGGSIKMEQFGAARQVGVTQFGVADYTYNYLAPAGTPTHLAFVSNSSTVTLYANGVAQGSVATTMGLPLQSIGKIPLFGGDPYRGTLDNVAVYNTALTPTQIQTNYNTGAGIGPAIGISITSANNVTAAQTINATNFTQTAGTGNTTLNGALATNGGAANITTNGNIQVGAVNTGGGNLTLSSGNTLVATGAITAGAGSISLAGNEIDLNGGGGSVTGSGTLQLQPSLTSQNIVVGGIGTTAALDITPTDLAAIGAGITGINIGATGGTGTVTLTSVPTPQPVAIVGAGTLVGANQNTTWSLTGSNSGSMTGFPTTVNFSNVANLTGGSANDTFQFGNGVTWVGAIDGGGGADSLNYSNYTTPLTLNLGTLPITGIESIVGTANATNTLVGANANTTWNITSANAGTVGTLNFSNFQSLIGGIGDDIFQFANGAGVSTGINGGGGANSLNYSAYTTPVTVNFQTNTATGSGSIANMQTAVGGTGSNTLIAPNTNNTFDLTGANSGILNGSFNFTAFQNLTGGNTDDTITFNGGSIGSIAGGGGNLTLVGDKIDYTGAISGSGQLAIQTATAGQPIQLGGSANASTVLDLTTAEISQLQDGFSQITIGSNTTPLAQADNLTFFDPLVLNASTYTTTTGALTVTGGSLTINATQSITTGDLTAAGQAITLTSGTSLTTGVVDTSSGTGSGGDVALTSGTDLQVAAINAQGSATGVGGNVAVTSNQLLRVTGAFTDQNSVSASISTAGGSGGGSITLNHRGGDLNTSFEVGNATTNGTAAAITSGSATLPTPQQVLNTVSQGNIQITNQGTLLTNQDNPLPPPSPPAPPVAPIESVLTPAPAAVNPSPVSPNIPTQLLNTLQGAATTAALPTDTAAAAAAFNPNNSVMTTNVIVNVGKVEEAISMEFKQHLGITDAMTAGFSGDFVASTSTVSGDSGASGSSGAGTTTGSSSLTNQLSSYAAALAGWGDSSGSSVGMTGGTSIAGATPTPGVGSQAGSSGGTGTTGTGSIASGTATAGTTSTGLTERSAGGNGAVGSGIAGSGGAGSSQSGTTAGSESSSTAGDNNATTAIMASLEQAIADAIQAERDGGSGSATNTTSTTHTGSTSQAKPGRDQGNADGMDTAGAAEALNSATSSSDSDESADEKARDAKNSTVQAQARLRQVMQATGVKPALLYVIFTSASGEMVTETDGKPKEDGSLTLVLVPPDGSTIAKQVQGIRRSQVLAKANLLRKEIISPRSTRYLPHAQQLYQWLIAPIETDLQANKIQSLSVITEGGLRSLPISALNDGKQFLIETYSVALMPSLNLTDTRLADIRQTKMLAMGASTFGKETKLADLPAVPTELSSIAGNLWAGDSAINNDFTLENLTGKRAERPYGIIHLATHADFEPGKLSNSYIQLWNKRLRLDQIRDLNWYDPPVSLVVLSACRTALGNDEAELGFAGFAVKAGAQSALASLWYVSDEGTLGFMTEFYRQLKDAPIKAEALRKTQLAMLTGQVKIEGSKLRGSRGGINLPDKLAKPGEQMLSHPFYWAAFTLIGSPW